MNRLIILLLFSSTPALAGQSFGPADNPILPYDSVGGYLSVPLAYGRTSGLEFGVQTQLFYRLPLGLDAAVRLSPCVPDTAANDTGALGLHLGLAYDLRLTRDIGFLLRGGLHRERLKNQYQPDPPYDSAASETTDSKWSTGYYAGARFHILFEKKWGPLIGLDFSFYDRLSTSTLTITDTSGTWNMDADSTIPRFGFSFGIVLGIGIFPHPLR